MSGKNLYIVAGCNGVGKTTASFTILPEILNCKEFINADEIAKGISPFQPEKVAIEAGRIMLYRIDELLSKNETFAIETTLSTKSYKSKIVKAKANGYKICLLFFWLSNVDLAKERVRTRVKEGGHNIPIEVIERRYLRGIRNFFDIYLSIVDTVFLFDNSEGKHYLFAEKYFDNEIIIFNQEIYNNLKKRYDESRKFQ